MTSNDGYGVAMPRTLRRFAGALTEIAEELDYAAAELVVGDRERFGRRVEDGRVMGTIVRCDKCGGSGELHEPDEMPPASTPESGA